MQIGLYGLFVHCSGAMSRGPELTEFQRGLVIGCHLCDLSVRAIASKLDIPKSSVAYVIKRWKQDGATKAKKRPGRPHKLTERDRRCLVRHVKKSRTSPAAAVAEEVGNASGSSVSVKTIRRELHEMGYHGRAAANKPLITSVNEKRRLAWCVARRSWTVNEWKTVLWSDESRYSLFQSDGRVWVWRQPGERFNSDCVVPTVKFGGGSILVWGCFSWFGLGPLVFVPSRMNSDVYLDVLDNSALPTLWQYYGTDGCFFQQDQAPCHTAGRVLDWFPANEVNLLDWPAQSPDLNPIEHLWDELERRVRHRHPRPSSQQSLFAALQEAWRAIPVQTYRNLVESMPRRVAAVIEAKGGPTRY